MSMPDGNSQAEAEYQRQQEFTASDYEYAERFRESLDIVARNAYFNPSSDIVIDALSNDEEVRAAWFAMVNLRENDSQEIQASCLRSFVKELDRYTKSCKSVIERAERLSR